MANSPWDRAEAKVTRLLDRVADNDEGPIQGVIIEEPFGYGTERLLRRIAHALERSTNRKPAFLASRHDGLTDWPSLAIEILSAASDVGLPHGRQRDTLIERRNAFGVEAFRDYIDELVQKVLNEHGRLDLLIPNLDQMLLKLDPNEHWAFRNILQQLPLAIVGTAAASWRPTRNEAFYEFFNRTMPEGYVDDDLPILAKQLGFKKFNQDQILELSNEVAGRPTLVEAAVSVMALEPAASGPEILRLLASTNAPAMHAALADTANQELLVISSMSRAGEPIGSGDLAELTGLKTGAVSTHLARLVKSGIVSADKSRGRNRLYDFADPVFGNLYSALNACPNT